jgi:hypothetical protein
MVINMNRYNRQDETHTFMSVSLTVFEAAKVTITYVLHHFINRKTFTLTLNWPSLLVRATCFTRFVSEYKKLAFENQEAVTERTVCFTKGTSDSY